MYYVYIIPIYLYNTHNTYTIYCILYKQYIHYILYRYIYIFYRDVSVELAGAVLYAVAVGKSEP